MLNCLRNNIPCLPKRLIPWVLQHAGTILLIVLSTTVILVFLTVKNFKVNTDLSEMIDNDLPFRQLVKKYHVEFPHLVAPIVVVLEGKVPEQVELARDRLVEKLEDDTTLFHSVYAPGKDTFFKHNGLLYLSTEELEERVDLLSTMQPFFARLSQDFSLSGLFSLLQQTLQEYDAVIADNEQITRLYSNLAEVFNDIAKGKKNQFSWQKQLSTGEDVSATDWQFIILQTNTNTQSQNLVKAAIKNIRQSAAELDLSAKHQVTLSITGKPVIGYEDLRSVRTDIGIASLVSFILVGTVLYIGLGSLRLVLAGLSTLVIGLLWTIAFAILIIGRLNMISVTFVVLFIGLGIDYSIQICLRYQEFLRQGIKQNQAINQAIMHTGNALLLCSISTAIGFYAFVPTAYVGASELGLISGTGMFIIFLMNVTLLPALLFLLPQHQNRPLPFAVGKPAAALLNRYSKLLRASAIISFFAALAFLPKVSFDANPFNLSDQRSKSVQTAMALFEGEQTSPWTISILTPNRKQAVALADRLRNKPEVRSAITVDDLVPKDQKEKLVLIEDLALFMPPPPQITTEANVPDFTSSREALAQLSVALDERVNSPSDDPEDVPTLKALNTLASSINTFEKLLLNPTQGNQLLLELQTSLLPNLHILFERLNQLTSAEEVTLAQLPRKVYDRFVAASGMHRVQVFPQNDLRDPDNLDSFVAAVSQVAPQATDQPVTIQGAGETIVSAFRNASLMAVILITLVLWLVMREGKKVILILAPLLLALCYAAAATVLLDIPFNFANIIVLPLLLGIGVDFSLHVVQRISEENGSGKHILETSTSRGVFFSSLTTIMSFGCLSFMHHEGTASMGKLLTLSIILMIFCTLIFLPAYLEKYGRS